MGRKLATGIRRKLASHDLDLQSQTTRRALAGDCGHRHHRARHLAHHAPSAHLLAGGAGSRIFSTWSVFYRARLFSDALLQVFFVAFTLYGWWHWWRGVRAEGEVRVVPLHLRGWLAGLAAGAVGAVLLGWLMVRIGAALPHLDAALTSYSLVASWWQARKHIANWWLWIAVDLIYIGEYHLQGSVTHGRALCRPCGAGSAGPARLAARAGQPLRSRPEPRCAAARR